MWVTNSSSGLVFTLNQKAKNVMQLVQVVTMASWIYGAIRSLQNYQFHTTDTREFCCATFLVWRKGGSWAERLNKKEK